jgi:hypothetical protein
LEKPANSIFTFALQTEVAGCCHLTELLFLRQSKGKAIPVLKHHNMNKHGGVEVQLHASLTSALDKVEWSALLAGRFILGKWHLYSLDRSIMVAAWSKA